RSRAAPLRARPAPPLPRRAARSSRVAIEQQVLACIASGFGTNTTEPAPRVRTIFTPQLVGNAPRSTRNARRPHSRPRRDHGGRHRERLNDGPGVLGLTEPSPLTVAWDKSRIP